MSNEADDIETMMRLLEWGAAMQDNVHSNIEWAITRAQAEAQPADERPRSIAKLAETIGMVCCADPRDPGYGTPEYTEAVKAKVLAQVADGTAPRAPAASPGQGAHDFVERERVLDGIKFALSDCGASLASSRYITAFFAEGKMPGRHDPWALPDDATLEQRQWWERGRIAGIHKAAHAIHEAIEAE